MAVGSCWRQTAPACIGANGMIQESADLLWQNHREQPVLQLGYALVTLSMGPVWISGAEMLVSSLNPLSTFGVSA